MRIVLLLFIVIFFSCVDSSQKKNDLSIQSISKIDSYIEDKILNNQIPGTVILVKKNDKIVHFKPYGYSNFNKKIKFKNNDIFRIASMTKIMPSIAVLQYWAMEEDFSKVNPKKSKILISAASYCYLDMKYDSITNLGLSWAGYLPMKKAYEWDPKNLVENFDPKQIIGLEAPLWSETIENFDDISYMAFPRIIGHAEIGWTNAIQRDWKDYSNRLSFHGRLLEAIKVKYYPASEIDWK